MSDERVNEPGGAECRFFHFCVSVFVPVGVVVVGGGAPAVCKEEFCSLSSKVWFVTFSGVWRGQAAKKGGLVLDS